MYKDMSQEKHTIIKWSCVQSAETTVRLILTRDSVAKQRQPSESESQKHPVFPTGTILGMNECDLSLEAT